MEPTYSNKFWTTNPFTRTTGSHVSSLKLWIPIHDKQEKEEQLNLHTFCMSRIRVMLYTIQIFHKYLKKLTCQGLVILERS
jgi:hypothetical protein